jgi:hypothetical protein
VGVTFYVILVMDDAEEEDEADLALPHVSTTGGPLTAESAAPAVILRPTDEAASTHGVTELKLGGGHAAVAHVGSDARMCEVILPPTAAPLQCQLALRSFKFPGYEAESDAVFEALFLRDVGDLPTRVNGRAAYRPWHWLQDGDKIGLGRPGTADCWTFSHVWYCSVHSLPTEPAALRKHIVASAPRKASPSPVPAIAVSSPLAATAATRGLSAPSSGRGAIGPNRRKGRGRGQCIATKAWATFDVDIVGKVIDLTYDNPVATYRVRVVEFDVATLTHIVNSEGYSEWVDENGSDTFIDEVFLRQMYNEGKVAIIGDGPGLTATASPPTPPEDNSDDDRPLSKLSQAKPNKRVKRVA